jgi:hypothetical protein
MPSTAHRRWTTRRANALDEIARAHAAVGGTGRGRRTTTQQVNQACAVLLAAQFQGFCRDLHAECVDHLVAAMTPSPELQGLALLEFTRGRQLDRGNAHPGNLHNDFSRLGIDFWPQVEAYDARVLAARAHLVVLNDWRNAVVHQDFNPARLGGETLRLGQVRRWRRSCQRLARAFDEVLRRHLEGLTATSPW